MSGGGSVLARAVVVISGDASDLDKVMSEAEKRVQKTGEALSTLGEKLMTHLTLPLAALGGVAVHSFGEQEDAIAKMNAVLSATGSEAGISSDHLIELSKALQQTTTFASAVTLSSMGTLLAFKNIRNEAGKGNDVFDRTVKVSQDLAELMGRDLSGAMLALGKTMEDPEQGIMLLRRANVILSDEVKEQIKNLIAQGRTLEAQKLVLTQVEGGIKDVAVAMAKTPMGQFRQAWNDVNDALEKAGKIIFEAVQPALSHVRGWAKDFQSWSEASQTVAVAVAAIAASLGIVLTVAGLVTKAWVSFSVILGSTAGTVGLAILALASLAAAGYTVVDNWIWLKQQAVALWTLIQDAFYTGVDSVLGALQTLLTGLGTAGSVMKHLPGIVGVLGIALDLLSNPLTSAAGGIQGMRDGLKAMHTVALLNANKSLVDLQNQLMATGVVAEQAGKKVGASMGKTFTPPAWWKQSEEAVKKLNASLDEAERKQRLLGKAFDISDAAKLYEEAIDAMLKAGVPLDSATDKYSIKLRAFASKFVELNKVVDDAKKSQNEFDDAITAAKSAVDESLTPTEKYEKTLGDLAVALSAGAINFKQFEAAVKSAQDAMDNATSMSHELNQALHDMVGRAVDDFVDFAFGAKKSFSEFIRSALQDLAKLILKVELLQLLFPKEKGGKFLGGIFGFAAGGFLGPGQVGLVGERGPELISGGAGGVQVTPMPVAFAGFDGGAALPGGMTMQFNINAMDSRDVRHFVEDNEGLFASTMMRAWAKSAAIRRMMEGR